MAMRARKTGCPFLLLLRFLCEIVVSAASSGRQTFSVVFDPPRMQDLVAGRNATFRVTLGFDADMDSRKSLYDTLPKNLYLRSLDDKIASTEDSAIVLRYEDLKPDTKGKVQFQTNFTVMGHFLGKTGICVQLRTADESLDSNDASYKQLPSPCDASGGKTLDVWVIQEKNHVVEVVFIVTLALLIIIANVLMGCELDLKMVADTVKKPVPPLIGFCTQFIAMPILAYCIAKLVFVSRGLDSFALGVFVTGCAPGGGASNYWTLLLDGNVPVSITMTFISTLAALVMMPLWMWALGSQFLRGYGEDFRVKVPYGKIVASLFSLIIPLLIGIALVRWKPAIQKSARKVVRPFLIFFLVFVIGFGTLANLYMFRIMTWSAVLGGLLLPWCGFAAGCFAALFARQDPKIVTAIAIETGIQNMGIAIMLLKISFPEPDSDISSLIPVIASCFTPVPLLCMVGVHGVIKYVKKRRLGTLELEKQLNSTNGTTPSLILLEKNEGKEENCLVKNLSLADA